MVFEWGVVCGHREEGHWLLGRMGSCGGAHWVYVVWREKRHVMAGGQSGRNGSGFGVECEFWEGGGCRVWCVPFMWGAGGWG